MFGSCAAGTTLIAWCWCGSNLAPAGGLTSTTLLRSSAVVSWRRVAWTPSSSCSGDAAGMAIAASRLSLHRQQALGEALDGELARLADFFLGAAADVLGLGLGAQIGVGELGVAGFEVGGVAGAGRRGRRSALPPLPAPFAASAAKWDRSRSSTRREAHPLHFKREFRTESTGISRGRPMRSSGPSRRAGDGRAWSAGPARSPAPARG